MENQSDDEDSGPDELDDWNEEISAPAQQQEPQGHKLLRIWGGLFRAMFIAAIGIGGYLFLDPPSIADRPLAVLTIRDILRNIFAVLLPIACLSWFLRFPDESKFDNVLTYEDWGKFGGWVALGAALIAWVIIGNS